MRVRSTASKKPSRTSCTTIVKRWERSRDSRRARRANALRRSTHAHLAGKVFFAGIDGGQTTTTALIADESGTILGRGVGGPCDEIAQTEGSRRLAAALEDALRSAFLDAGLDPETECASIVAGISGYDGTIVGAAPRLRAGRIRLMHDAPIALAGAIDGPGIVLVAGTGSVAYGEDAGGRGVRAGGWGYLFGDRGSAFWIARTALEGAMRTFDSGQSSRLAEAALEHFEVADLRALAQAFYLGRISRAELAAFAPVVGDAANAGDAPARTIIEEGAIALSELVVQVKRRLDFPPRVRVAMSGGAFLDATLRTTVERTLRTDPGIELVAAQTDPMVGALRLAFREAGLKMPR
jgi:glucosamine kinase